MVKPENVLYIQIFDCVAKNINYKKEINDGSLDPLIKIAVFKAPKKYGLTHGATNRNKTSSSRNQIPSSPTKVKAGRGEIRVMVQFDF